jgi:hypothetical protein
VFVGTTARDRHNNDLTAGTSVVFSTGATFPAGRIEGEVEAHGFAGPGTYLWCYHAERTGVPDSTARDFDAVGLVDEKSEFRIDGLTVPGRYRLWAFADINANRSFEPDRDFLAPVDTTFELTEAHPVAGPVHVRLRNPRAPGTIVGAVIDSLHDSLGVTRIIAIGAVDSSLRVLADINPDRTFEISLRAGTVGAARVPGRGPEQRLEPLERAGGPAGARRARGRRQGRGRAAHAAARPAWALT